MENEIMYIKLDDIIPNRFQPREIFDEDALNKLADSIRQHGVIEPILVRPVSNKYEIIAGERRYKASILAGLTKIPAMVRQLDDKESSILAFVENEHRDDVSAIEEAKTMDRILKANNMTQEELANELGINQSTIANKIRLLNLPLEVQESLMRNEISERHARSLLSVKNEEKQIELLRKIKEKRMTVRELEKEIKDMNNMNDNMNIYENMDLSDTSGNMNNINGNFNPIPPVAPSIPQEEPGFMDFLNNYDNNHQVPSEPVAPVAPNVPQEEPGFMDFLNNYDNNHQVPSEPVAPNVSQEEPGFMDFLNNYDNNHQVPSEPVAPVTQNVPQEEPGFMDFLNNYDNNHQVPSEPVAPVAPNVSQEEPGFMDFLNNYDNNHQVPSEPAAPVAPNVPQEEPGFMDFLNNYDNNHQVPSEPVAPVAPNVPQEEPGFMDFLNNYDNNHQVPQEPVVPEVSVQESPANLQENMPGGLNEPLINNVTPPITTDFSNQYIEDNPNYVDITKQNVINSVDEIISKLKSVVDEIKTNSKFKVDTDEINYDDIYQITIKIDKRDF